MNVRLYGAQCSYIDLETIQLIIIVIKFYTHIRIFLENQGVFIISFFNPYRLPS